MALQPYTSFMRSLPGTLACCHCEAASCRVDLLLEQQHFHTLLKSSFLISVLPLHVGVLLAARPCPCSRAAWHCSVLPHTVLWCWGHTAVMSQEGVMGRHCSGLVAELLHPAGSQAVPAPAPVLAMPGAGAGLGQLSTAALEGLCLPLRHLFILGSKSVG